MKSISLKSILCIILFLSLPLQAAPISLLVPAYANPCCGGGPTMWNNLITAATNPDLEVGLILNPASGPGTATDPNFVDASGNGPLVDFRNAGGKVYGYVPTQYSSRPQADVLADVDKYYDTLYSGLVDGIFFDEMSNNLAHTGYYQTLRDYVHNKTTGSLVIGNPGTGFVNNPSGQTTYVIDDYVQSADVLMTFESDANAYLNSYVPPSWVGNYPANRFAHVVHTLGTWDANFVDLATARNAGYVYFTDDQMPNPYDQLASFWDQEVTDLAAANTTAVPAPATFWLFTSGLFLLFPARRKLAI